MPLLHCGMSPQCRTARLRGLHPFLSVCAVILWSIADQEFIVLVGPSGCGKSTTLRMVAGLEEISEGQLLIDGKVMNDVAPKDRDIAMVFQSYALYPHMTVYENMAFSLKLKKVPKDEIDRKVKEAAEILDITQYLDRKPKALSGGQRQRVAIGRAIVREPKVFLMDEPLSNLDAKLRNQMRAEIIKLRQKINTTFIYVTHDQTEAMTLGDRIVIMRDGFIQQIGTPQQVFDHPANLFVAGFIGTPQMNFFDAKLEKDGNGYYVYDSRGAFILQANRFSKDMRLGKTLCAERASNRLWRQDQHHLRRQRHAPVQQGRREEPAVTNIPLRRRRPRSFGSGAFVCQKRCGASFLRRAVIRRKGRIPERFPEFSASGGGNDGTTSLLLSAGVLAAGRTAQSDH